MKSPTAIVGDMARVLPLEERRRTGNRNQSSSLGRRAGAPFRISAVTRDYHRDLATGEMYGYIQGDPGGHGVWDGNYEVLS